MRIAVVTPYHNETVDILRRCHASVKSQTHSDMTHIMVADGDPHPWCKTQNIEQIVLPVAHNDAGATPRALGALSAFSRGYDAVAFLDADNWYEPNHIEKMIDTMRLAATDAVVATRTIHALDGSALYVDTVESNGDNMVDTNCMFMGRSTALLQCLWMQDASKQLIGDKLFWKQCEANGMRYAKCSEPTVAYVSRWAWHYQYAGVAIPPDSVWLYSDPQGNYMHVKHSERGEIA
jgi:glycosyltransferase involved in cell wall biosynthesis